MIHLTDTDTNLSVEAENEADAVKAMRERWQIDGMRRSCRAAVKHPSLIVRWYGCLAEVWALDGKAVVFPATGGVLVVDWFAFMRYARRHDLLQRERKVPA
jgi:hypothetical protein